ncbi:alpha/beta hydrolase family protein [Candidatus Margulisiibacteriota bacterium]
MMKKNEWNLRLNVSVPLSKNILTAKFIRRLICFLLLTTPSFAFFNSPYKAVKKTESIWKLPQNIQAITKKEYIKDNIVVKEIQYISSYYKGNPVKIFGYYCYPKGKQNLPGVAIIHGGGGYAVLSRTINFAKNGYASISIDLPGKGQLRWKRSRSTGPDMDVPTLLRVEPDISHNYLYHAVPAARCAISFLVQQPQVNKNKIGMVGLSWGGVITLMVNGTDKRLAAAVPVFGSGWLDHGSTWQARFDEWMSETDKQTYNKYFDAKNYVTTQHAPLLYMTGSNDHCYYVPNFIKSYLNMPIGKAKLAIYPNGKHRVTMPMLMNIYRFLNHKLRGGNRFPDLTLSEIKDMGNVIMVPVGYKGPSLAKNVSLWYSQSGISGWTIKKWYQIKAIFHKNKYYINVPKQIISPEVQYFITLTDTSGKFVTTPVYSLMRLKTNKRKTLYITTTPIEEIIYHRISPAAWKKITGKSTDIAGERILFSNLKRIGAKIEIRKNYYYVELP